MKRTAYAKKITIIIGGQAGQGIQTTGALLAKACHHNGLSLFSTDDFESRIWNRHHFHVLTLNNNPVFAPFFKNRISWWPWTSQHINPSQGI